MSETKHTPGVHKAALEICKRFSSVFLVAIPTDIHNQVIEIIEKAEPIVNARPQVEELVGMIVHGKLKKGLSEDDPFYLDELEAKAYAVKAALGGKAE